jgi:hypothetical protein
MNMYTYLDVKNSRIKKDYVKLLDRNDTKDRHTKHSITITNKGRIYNDNDKTATDYITINNDINDDSNENDDDNDNENESYLIQIYKEIKENENRIMKFEDNRRKLTYANLKMSKQ